MPRRARRSSSRSPSRVDPAKLKCAAEFAMAAQVMRSSFVPSRPGRIELACGDYTTVEKAARLAAAGDCSGARRALSAARCRPIAKAPRR